MSSVGAAKGATVTTIMINETINRRPAEEIASAFFNWGGVTLALD